MNTCIQQLSTPITYSTSNHCKLNDGAVEGGEGKKKKEKKRKEKKKKERKKRIT
jgi:hypothetical protein